MDAVWGVFDSDAWVRVHWGMIVARGMPREDDGSDMPPGPTVPVVCPVWHDRVPYKSVTVICSAEQEDEVTYWLEYVHGGNSVSRRSILPDGRVALRSDYQCW